MDLENKSFKLFEININEEHFKHETLLEYNYKKEIDDNY